MLSSGLCRRAALLGLLALGACGFAPAFGPGGTAEAWQNRVLVQAPETIFGFRMGAHLTQSLGVPASADYTLTITPREAPVSATITEDGDITRFNLTGNADWVLADAQGATVTKGLAQTFTSYSATGSTVATQSAEDAARDRLAVALADLIIQQLLTQASPP